MKITSREVLRRIKNFLCFHSSWLLAPDSWILFILLVALFGAFIMALPTAARGVEIQWLGTAEFALYYGNKTLLIDPYFSRNKTARPLQPLGTEDFPDTRAILISHGKTVLPIDGFSVTAHTSKHVVFDFPLIWRTLRRARFNLLKYMPLLTKWPKGQVFSYRIEMEGLCLHHFGTAGCRRKELEDLSRQPLDILLVPLQGHSHICRIGANITKVLNPKMVIVHHHDDFYPPASTKVDIQPFIDEIQKECPAIIVKELQINRIWKVELEG